MVDFDIDNIVVEHIESTGETRFFKTIQVGGIDENGTYELVLDGPAQGERVYK